MTFKEWLKENPHDLNTNFINCSFSGLTDLEGIEQFKNLEILYCSGNHITEIPGITVLNQLKNLDCSDNPLTSLPDLRKNKNLEILDCSYCLLFELPNLGQNLKELYSSFKSMSFPEFSFAYHTISSEFPNWSLKALYNYYLNDGIFTKISDLSKCKKLVILLISNANIKELPDLSKCINLKELECSNNRLSKLPDLSKCKRLEKLICYTNSLSELPELKDCQNLRFLACEENNLPFNDIDGYNKWNEKYIRKQKLINLKGLNPKLPAAITRQ